MKKLYKASSFREFCFIFDSAKHKTPEDAAYEYVGEVEGSGDVDDIWEVTDPNDIPSDWYYSVPLGLDFKADCCDFLQNQEWAKKIAEKLEALDYELEDTFVEDLWKAAKDGDNEWNP